jgi:hypothetical protein
MRMGWVGRHGEDVGDRALAMAGVAKAVVKMVRRDRLRIMLPPIDKFIAGRGYVTVQHWQIRHISRI